MAKPDWGVLQQRFLSEHAATGVSPKEWCEAQGLNYATARRYIKKPSAQTAQTAQTAQKPAQKKMRTAQKDKSANELVDDEGLTAQQRRFVAEYLKDANATQAAIRAGYSKRNADKIGPELLGKTRVAQAIAQQQKASIARTLGSADEVLAQMWQLATFDANQLSQYRRGACRYCWGFGHQYQWRDAVEFEEKRLEAVERDRREPEDSGGYGYDHNREPNPECPRCNGDGIGQPYFPDTRKLPAASRLAYSGVKVGKNGVEITAISRERMFEAVMKRLGLADSEFAQRLQQIEIERRQLEVEKLRKELEGDSDDDEPTPVQININVVDARADDGDQPDT
ncbi:terminase small subunit [Enterobacter cloacae subsp. cloacae]|uniref:terminase small subunit n=1 Tax=Enterobacter cloacae TaxID=550 RepID=UPI001C5BB2E4|nr:terminase small subunit [Enterobacter cloacae]MBW4214367.1 terminase small subunit [Enterobacter cloacae subsp. cloacae]